MKIYINFLVRLEFTCILDISAVSIFRTREWNFNLKVAAAFCSDASLSTRKNSATFQNRHFITTVMTVSEFAHYNRPKMNIMWYFGLDLSGSGNIWINREINTISRLSLPHGVNFSPEDRLTACSLQNPGYEMCWKKYKGIILPSLNLRTGFGIIVFFKRNDGTGPFSVVVKF
jgi:hypothetical protein